MGEWFALPLIEHAGSISHDSYSVITAPMAV
jgi:hypothetical protein